MGTILFLVVALILIYLSNTGQLKQLRTVLASPATSNAKPTNSASTPIMPGGTSGSTYIPGWGNVTVTPNNTGIPPGGSNSNGVPFNEQLPTLGPNGTIQYGPSSTSGSLSGDISELEDLF